MHGTRKHGLAALAAVATVAMAAGTQAQDFSYGQDLFETRCAICHGPTGAGDGEMAEFFAQAPRDLTMMTAENDGAFPFQAVYESIDGRRDIAAHGSSEMPIWGDFLKAEAQAMVLPNIETAEEVVQGRILALVYYLQTVQQ